HSPEDPGPGQGPSWRQGSRGSWREPRGSRQAPTDCTGARRASGTLQGSGSRFTEGTLARGGEDYHVVSSSSGSGGSSCTTTWTWPPSRWTWARSNKATLINRSTSTTTASRW